MVKVQAEADPEAARQRKADHARRSLREAAAPGLTLAQRKALLRRWKAQGRRCAYCPGVVETVDHVTPLALGGTHYEGNLVPCCWSCNRRKSDSLLIRWKLKRRTPTPTPLPISA